MSSSPRQAGKLGRTANSGKPRLTLTADAMPVDYDPPATLDRYSAVSVTTWGMDGNDNVGDCTCADVDHEAKAMQVAAGNTEVASTAEEVLAAYSAITGYNPDDPDTDQGAEMQDVRAYWQKTGFTLGGLPDRILMFAELDHTNTALVQWALDQVGAIGLGVNFPTSAMDQFNAGEPWSVVKGSTIEGGHAVALLGYDETYWYVLTWGAIQKVEQAWFAAYVEEAWLSLSADFVDQHTGTDPLGSTLYQLGVEFAALTGKANPVSPTPTPAPGPQPTPIGDPDHHLADAVRVWAFERHFGPNERVAHAVQQWLTAKGL